MVGEVRGAEITDLLTAMNTGHEGGCGTVHANSAGDVPARLEALAALGGMVLWLCYALATLVVYAIYYTAVGLFYLFAAIFGAVGGGLRQRKARRAETPSQVGGFLTKTPSITPQELVYKTADSAYLMQQAGEKARARLDRLTKR